LFFVSTDPGCGLPAARRMPERANERNWAKNAAMSELRRAGRGRCRALRLLPCDARERQLPLLFRAPVSRCGVLPALRHCAKPIGS